MTVACPSFLLSELLTVTLKTLTRFAYVLSDLSLSFLYAEKYTYSSLPTVRCRRLSCMPFRHASSIHSEHFQSQIGRRGIIEGSPMSFPVQIIMAYVFDDETSEAEARFLGVDPANEQRESRLET